MAVRGETMTSLRRETRSIFAPPTPPSHRHPDAGSNESPKTQHLHPAGVSRNPPFNNTYSANTNNTLHGG